VFGTDIEPIISTGVLRAVGGDISSRVGEADIIPFSRFLADRRSLAEKLKDPAISAGAAGGMISNIVNGAQTIADGDLLAGMQQMLPMALQGPAKAIDLALNGYTDKNRNKLPITPHASDVMWQLFGIRPGQAADYTEARRAQAQRTAILTREAATIRRNLVVAIERGDRERMAEEIAKAREYERAHPGLSILDGVVSAMQQRARARALAGATNLPIGVNMRDVGARSATRFFQAQ
jgi:hypothetical protein